MVESGQREGGPMEPLWHFLTPTLLATLTPASPGAPNTNGGVLGGRLSALKPAWEQNLDRSPDLPISYSLFKINIFHLTFPKSNRLFPV